MADPLLQAAGGAWVPPPEVLALIGEIKGARPVVSMSELLARVSRDLGVQFTLGGIDIDAAAVFSPSGMLPAVAWLAQDAGRRLLDADLGCELVKPAPTERVYLGARCVVPHVTGHIADLTRALFFMHSAEQMFGMQRDSMLEIQPVQEALWPVFSAYFSEKEIEQGVVPWPVISHTA